MKVRVKVRVKVKRVSVEVKVTATTRIKDTLRSGKGLGWGFYSSSVP